MTFLSSNRKDYIDLVIAFFIALCLFLVLKVFGVLNLGNSFSKGTASLPVVFLIGLTAGVSTCMALVGGLVLGMATKFAKSNPNATSIEKFKPHLFFNFGRVVAYFIFRGLIGFAGSLFQLSTTVLGILTITVGLVMLLLGGQLIEIFPILKRISFTIPKRLSRIFVIKENPVIMGALTFFLPCGFTQAMQLYAISTGSILWGSLIMGVFALGTTPGLLGIGGITSIIKKSASKIFFKTAGVIVVLLALLNISNGLNILGLKSTIKTPELKSKIVSGIQEVRMTQDFLGYSPNNFTIKKGVPVRWIITSTDAYTCTSSIVSQQLGIRAGLKLGQNIFEFTPTKTGTIRFSCGMGMYTGSFTVTP